MKSIYVFFVLCLGSPFGACQTNKYIDETIDKVVETFNAGNYEDCIRYADILISEDSTDYISWTIKGRALFNLNKANEGIEALNTAIDVNPSYSDAYVFRAILASQMMNFDTQQVLNDFTSAMKYKPKRIDVIKFKGHFLSKIHHFDLAIDEYNKYLEFDSVDYSVLVQRGRAFRNTSNHLAALSDLNRAIDLSPEQTTGYEERAFLHLEMANFFEALDDFTTLTKLAKNEGPEFSDAHAYTYNNRGFVYYKLGMMKEALQDINLSLEMLPTNPYAFKNRALVQIAQQDFNTACVDLLRARELGYRESFGDEVDILIRQHCE